MRTTNRTQGERVNRLLIRLARICFGLGMNERSVEIWRNGITKIEQKFNVQIYLSDFRPSGFIRSEQSTCTLSIVPTNEVM